MDSFNPLRQIRIDDEVAVLRWHITGREVLRIARVKFIGHLLIQTDGDGYYSVSDGKSIGNRDISYIEPVTNAHRTALRQRHRESRNRPLATVNS